MRLTTKILIGILMGLILGNTLWTIADIRKEIQFNKESIQYNNNILSDKLDLINERLDNHLFILSIMNKTDQLIIESVQNLPQKIKTNKFLLEQKLKQVNVMVINNGKGLGSGVTLKYKNEYYILTAGHMCEDAINDKLELWENGMKICDLKVIKHSFNFDTEYASQVEDLLLLQPTDETIVPRFYVELADSEPITSTEIYIVGNPMGIEDMVSDGRVSIYKNNIMYYKDHTYYGNSGGGVYDKEGKMIGIVSHYQSLKPNPMAPEYLIYGAIRLSVIQSFLKDVK
jgi:S1-C subfamily serine protease